MTVKKDTQDPAATNINNLSLSRTNTFRADFASPLHILSIFAEKLRSLASPESPLCDARYRIERHTTSSKIRFSKAILS
jgi:hypothetical protein